MRMFYAFLEETPGSSHPPDGVKERSESKNEKKRKEWRIKEN